MLINQVSKMTGLTKKAIDYYTAHGLLKPSVSDNGYRDYTNDDIEILNRISVLRNLDIGINEIKTILADKSTAALQLVSVRKELHFQREAEKNAILTKLINGAPYSQISAELQTINNSKTITEKLLEDFPGYYGRYLCLHLAGFLNEPIKTEVQQSAYDTIISFLDNLPAFTLPQDLQEYLTEATRDIGAQQITEIIESTKKSIENPDCFLSDNKELLEQYLAYKQSDEYKSSPAYKISEYMKNFFMTSGYYDVFIPALKQLSTSYSKYQAQLQKADKALRSKFPEQY